MSNTKRVIVIGKESRVELKTLMRVCEEVEKISELQNQTEHLFEINRSVVEDVSTQMAIHDAEYNQRKYGNRSKKRKRNHRKY